MSTGRSLTVAAVALVMAPASFGEALLFHDDFESGNLNLYDGILLNSGGTAAASAAAAHDGVFGLRVTDTSTTDTGNGPASPWEMLDAGLPSDRYLRGWARITTASDAGTEVTLFDLFANGGNRAICDIAVNYPSAEATVAADDSALGFRTADSGVPLTSGTWHLLECGVLDAGTAAVELVLWIDGVERARLSGVSQPGWMADELDIGETYADDGRFVGTIDEDDVAVTRVPPASRLVLDAGAGPFAAGSCVPLTALVRSSAGTQATLLRAQQLNAAVLSGAAALYSDGACTLVGGPVLAAGAASGTVFLRAQQWPVIVSVGTTDLIGSTYQISGAGLGAADGGPVGLGPLEVACGCSSAAAAPVALLALTLALRGRRVRRPSSGDCRP